MQILERAPFPYSFLSKAISAPFRSRAAVQSQVELVYLQPRQYHCMSSDGVLYLELDDLLRGIEL